MLDAKEDMTATWHPDFPLWLQTEASGDGSDVLIQESNIEYRLPLLLRAGLEWKYTGPTHEYLDTILPMGLLDGLIITHHADSSNRSRNINVISSYLLLMWKLALVGQSSIQRRPMRALESGQRQPTYLIVELQCMELGRKSDGMQSTKQRYAGCMLIQFLVLLN
jgi:hypothetical protein